ncbi:MAG: hypothetical protein ABI769_13025 [Pseudomonadota bacterium]
MRKVRSAFVPAAGTARWVTAFIAIFAAAPGLADTAVCNGKLTTVGNHANGINGLYVVVGDSNIIRVCNFAATQFTVTVDDCKHMASLAALAFATEASVTFYIDNAPSTVCSAIPGWFVANTRYFSVNK